MTLPSQWKCDRLKDVAAVNAESLPAGTDPDYEFDYLEISNVDYHGIVNLQAITRMRFEDAPSRARRRARVGSTIVSSVRPNLQAVAHIGDWAGIDFVCSTGFNAVYPTRFKLHERFAYYVLISETTRQYFEATAKGVGYPAVDDKDFKALQVPLPPIAEQHSIATFLDRSCKAIDEAIAGKREQLALLDGVRETTIEKAVTHGLGPNVRLAEVGQDWIVSLPVHWQPVRIKRLLSRMDYGISESTERDGRYPVLKMGNIQGGEIRFTNIEFVESVEDDLILEADDILYNRTNSADQVGKAAIYRGSKADGVTFASYLVRLRVNHRILPAFLNYAVNSSGFLSFARKLAIPSVQQSNLNSTRYGRIFVPLPPLDEQREICAYLEVQLAQLKAITSTIEAQIATLTAYRKSLIHEYVTGQRRVPVEQEEKAVAYG